MNLLDRYIGRSIIGATLIVVLILVGLYSFIEFLNQLSDIGKGNFTLLSALIYVPLLLPQDLYQLFPVAGLIGSLLGLGRLATNSELIVMRASGVSKARIIASVVKTTIFMLIFVTALGEIIAPRAKDFAENYKALAESGGQALQTRQGAWVRDGDNFIHIDTVSPEGKLQGITRYKFANQDLQLASSAKEGYFKDGQWMFNQVEESRIDQKKVTTQHFEKQFWNVSFNPNLLGVTDVKAEQATLLELHRYINYLKNAGLLATQYEFSLWKRLFQPIATIVMICLAIPFIFGPLRSVTMGLRLLIGVIIGFSFYTLNEFFGPFSLVYQFPPIWAAAIPILIFAIVDSVLLWKFK
jgi:lipopolysaccharide export system permease protein